MADLLDTDMRYLVSGEHGEVRLVHFPVNYQRFDVPFQFCHGGWHRCNSKYRLDRLNDFAEHILLFSLTDGGVLEFEDEPPLLLPASSVTWIPPHSKHSYYTRAGHIWELYWLHLADDPHIRFDLIFQNNHFFYISHMEKITREMEKLLQNKQIHSFPFALETSRVSSYIYHILLQESIEKQESFYKKDTLISAIIHEMTSNCNYDWKLPELSEKYFISVPQLIRRFKSTTGMSPHAYLMSIRLHSVAEYLRYTNLSIAEISLRTGFASSCNMISQFRKRYGITPGQYRETNR